MSIISPLKTSLKSHRPIQSQLKQCLSFGNYNRTQLLCICNVYTIIVFTMFQLFSIADSLLLIRVHFCVLFFCLAVVIVYPSDYNSEASFRSSRQPNIRNRVNYKCECDLIVHGKSNKVQWRSYSPSSSQHADIVQL